MDWPVEVFRYGVAVVLALAAWIHKLTWEEIKTLRQRSHQHESWITETRGQLRLQESQLDRTLTVIERVEQRLDRMEERRT